MVPNNSMASANERLARQINQEARQDPTSPYAGKLVGIAKGQVIVVADTWREGVERLRQGEPDAARCRCLEASADYERVEAIWRVADTGGGSRPAVFPSCAMPHRGVCFVFCVDRGKGKGGIVRPLECGGLRRFGLSFLETDTKPKKRKKAAATAALQRANDAFSPSSTPA